MRSRREWLYEEGQTLSSEYRTVWAEEGTLRLYRTCPGCDGTGRVVSEQQTMRLYRNCLLCGTSGKFLYLVDPTPFTVRTWP